MRIPCLTDQQITQFLSGSLDPEERTTYIDHIAACPRCEKQLEKCAEVVHHDPGPREVDSLPSFAHSSNFATDGSSPASGIDPLSILDGFQILRQLQEDSRGLVVFALKKSTAQNVMLRFLKPPASEKPLVAEISPQAEIIAGLDHPNLCKLFEICSDNQVPYTCRQASPGRLLSTFLGNQPISANLSAQILEPIANALHVVHQQGLIHGDLTPNGILLAGPGEDLIGPEIPMVMELGLPYLFSYHPAGEQAGTDHPSSESSDQWQRSLLRGHIQYQAPEQIRGEADQLGPATDIYAMGCILYEMLTGRPPFVGPTSLKISIQVLERAPVEPHILYPEVPQELERICLKCLEKNPKDRYASSEELAEALDSYLTHLDHSTTSEQFRPHSSRKPSFLKCLIVMAFIFASGLSLGAVVQGFFTGSTGLQSQPFPARSPKPEAQIKSAQWDDQLRQLEASTDHLHLLHKQSAQGVELLRQSWRSLRQRIQALLIQNQQRKSKDRKSNGPLAYLCVKMALLAHSLGESGDVDSLIQSAAALLKRHRPTRDLNDLLHLAEAYRILGRIALARQDKTAIDHLELAQAQYRELFSQGRKDQRALQGMLEVTGSLYRIETSRENASRCLELLALQEQVCHSLCHTAPKNVDYKKQHVDSLIALAQAHASFNQFTQAFSAATRAEQLAAPLLAIPAQAVQTRAQMAQALKISAQTIGKAPKRDLQAQQKLEEAGRLIDQILQWFPDHPTYLDELASIYEAQLFIHSKGLLLITEKEDYQRTASLREHLVLLAPHKNGFRVKFAKLCLRGGRSDERRNRINEALEKYQKAIAVLEPVWRDAPGGSELRNAYLDARKRRGHLHFRMKQYHDATRDLQLILPHLKVKKMTRISLGLAYAHLGQPRKVEEVLEPLLEARQTLPDSCCYNVACAFALCVTKIKEDKAIATSDRQRYEERYGDPAMLLLQRLFQNGFFLKPPYRKLLQEDEDLIALRPRADFRDLAGKVEQQASKDCAEPSLAAQ